MQLDVYSERAAEPCLSHPASDSPAAAGSHLTARRINPLPVSNLTPEQITDQLKQAQHHLIDSRSISIFTSRRISVGVINKHVTSFVSYNKVSLIS